MFEERIEKIKNILDDKTCALILSEPNVFYLTGMLSSEGKVFITNKKAYFLVDFRYIEKARQTAKHLEVLCVDNFSKQMVKLLEENRAEIMLTETQSVSYSDFIKYQNNFPMVKLSADNTLDEALIKARQIKSEYELSKIREAQRLTDETFSYICEQISAGRTELEVMLDMEFYIRKSGSNGVSFDFIVVSGKNSSMPHGAPSEKIIETGDFVTMDFGAVVDGYRSDMTRTVAIGNINEEQTKVYNTVLAAQMQALKSISAGKKCSDIDKKARDIIYNAGYEGAFGHALGHSVGIEIHETPNFSPKCDEILKAGTVMTVEPGIYLENKFGVRIEDMVFVTENGCENITKSKKELLNL